MLEGPDAGCQEVPDPIAPIGMRFCLLEPTRMLMPSSDITISPLSSDVCDSAGVSAPCACPVCASLCVGIVEGVAIGEGFGEGFGVAIGVGAGVLLAAGGLRAWCPCERKRVV